MKIRLQQYGDYDFDGELGRWCVEDYGPEVEVDDALYAAWQEARETLRTIEQSFEDLFAKKIFDAQRTESAKIQADLEKKAASLLEIALAEQGRELESEQERERRFFEQLKSDPKLMDRWQKMREPGQRQELADWAAQQRTYERVSKLLADKYGEPAVFSE